MKKLLSLLLSLVMLLSVTAGLNFTAKAAVRSGTLSVSSLSKGDELQYGYYPSARVTSSSTIAEFEKLNIPLKHNTIPYYWYQGSTGNPTGYGMSYTDFVFRDKMYRKLEITRYKPRRNYLQPSAENSYQDDNGYYLGTYYFEWQPITWVVAVTESGGVVLWAKNIIDAESFRGYENNLNLTYTELTWENSTIRKFLNNTFYNTAFRDEEKASIVSRTNANQCFWQQEYKDGGWSKYHIKENGKTLSSTSEKVFLLSIQEMMDTSSNTIFTQSSTYAQDDARKRTNATDYAKAMGYGFSNPGVDVFVEDSTPSAKYATRTTGEPGSSDFDTTGAIEAVISNSGNVGSNWDYAFGAANDPTVHRNQFDTGMGICPAIKLNSSYTITTSDKSKANYSIADMYYKVCGECVLIANRSTKIISLTAFGDGSCQDYTASSTPFYYVSKSNTIWDTEFTEGMNRLLIRKSVKRVGAYLFKDCDFYTIEFEQDASSTGYLCIGKYAFYDVNSKDAPFEIELPYQLQEVEDYAFANAEIGNLNAIKPKNCTYGQHLFNYCTDLTTAQLGKPVYIGASMFSGCTKLNNIQTQYCTHVWSNKVANKFDTNGNPWMTDTSKVKPANENYSITIKTPATCTTSGKKQVKWDCGFTEDGEVIPPSGHYFVSGKEYCQNGCGTKNPNHKKSIGAANVTNIKAKVYNGKAQKQKLTVKLGKVTLTEGTDYTVAYKNNTKVGTAKAVITGKGKYTGSLTKSFNINPQATTLSAVTSPKSKNIKVTWKKKATQTTGYQIQYCKTNKFKKGATKTVTVKNNKSTAKTVANFAGKTKYYVRVRTYKTVNGKNYYSAWTAAKTVTTKK